MGHPEVDPGAGERRPCIHGRMAGTKRALRLQDAYAVQISLTVPNCEHSSYLGADVEDVLTLAQQTDIWYV